MSNFLGDLNIDSAEAKPMSVKMQAVADSDTPENEVVPVKKETVRKNIHLDVDIAERMEDYKVFVRKRDGLRSSTRVTDKDIIEFALDQLFKGVDL